MELRRDSYSSSAMMVGYPGFGSQRPSTGVSGGVAGEHRRLWLQGGAMETDQTPTMCIDLRVFPQQPYKLLEIVWTPSTLLLKMSGGVRI